MQLALYGLGLMGDLDDDGYEEVRPERRRRDRRALEQTDPWRDPRLYVSLLAVLLTLCIGVLGFIWAQLAAINATMQTMVVSNSRQGVEIETLKNDMREIKKEVSDQEKRENDYHFNLSNRLKGVEVEIKMKDDKQGN
jgi:hypothetical protein